jgi:hypothetical protein
VFSNGVRDFKNWDEDHDARWLKTLKWCIQA